MEILTLSLSKGEDFRTRKREADPRG